MNYLSFKVNMQGLIIIHLFFYSITYKFPIVLKTCSNPKCLSKLKINTTAHIFISISLIQFMLMILIP